jgi:hypothetical protein
MISLEKKTLEIFFPKDTFEWFDVIESNVVGDDVLITLQEKNIPPVTDADKEKKVEAKGFAEIAITDFPIRGKRSLLTFRRRYWQVEGQDTYLKREIKLNFPGTQLEQEFAVFLKESSRDVADLADMLGYAKPPAT